MTLVRTVAGRQATQRCGLSLVWVLQHSHQVFQVCSYFVVALSNQLRLLSEHELSSPVFPPPVPDRQFGDCLEISQTHH